MAPINTSAVSIQRVEKTYPNGTRALLPVDLNIQRGEFVTLLGPSGCGKSTLLNMVAGLLAPSCGSISISGELPLANAKPRANHQRLSFVFQEATLMPWARVAANVRLPLDLQSVPRAEAEQRVGEALKLVGLDKFADAYPRELSGGMQMRASIARSLVTDPSLLLMDEPFGALDEITRNRLDDELLALWRAKNLTVIFVTHSIHEAVYLSSRVIVMAARPGRVVDEVMISPTIARDEAFRVSTEFAAFAKQLQDALLRASVSIEDALA
ncbi:MAG: ABC transporter ATP-binding protein [Rhizobacter sp.]|nr:ABC transporter ATP-binding protein [Burkholderiales bacterium]